MNHSTITLGGIAVLLFGCAEVDVRKVGAVSADLVLRRPIEMKCSEKGLQACPELVDGIVLYIEGKKTPALEQLKVVAARNAPEKVREFASAVTALSSIPSLREKMGLIADATAFIVRQAELGRTVAKPAPIPTVASGGRPADVPAVPGPTLDGETVQADAGMVMLAGLTRRWSCGSLGMVFDCVPFVRGPFVVTSAQVLGACPLALALVLVPAGDISGPPRWMASTKRLPVLLQGAQLSVRSNEMLMAGIERAKGEVDGNCAIAWTGFRSSTSVAGDAVQTNLAEAANSVQAGATPVDNASKEKRRTVMGGETPSSRDSGDAAQLVREGYDLFQEAKYLGAIGKYQEALALQLEQPTLAIVYRGLGSSYLKVGDLANAIKYLQLYWALAPPAERAVVGSIIDDCRRLRSTMIGPAG